MGVTDALLDRCSGWTALCFLCLEVGVVKLEADMVKVVVQLSCLHKQAAGKIGPLVTVCLPWCQVVIGGMEYCS